MKSVLRELYSGKILPYERHVIYGPEFYLLDKQVAQQKKKFIEGLSEENARHFEELEKTRIELDLSAEIESYCAGFRLGMQITAEVFAAPAITEYSSDRRSKE